MDFYFMNDAEIGKKIGRRINALRLRKNWSQKEISEFTGLSINAIKSVEGGKGKLISIIKILRALKSLDSINNFIPEPEVSPVQLAKLKGKIRIRATGTKKRKDNS